MNTIPTPAAAEASHARLVDAVRAAAADGRTLRISGGASKPLVQPLGPAQPLSTLEHRGILAHEPTELVVTVRAGTPLAELESALAEHGQYLPFEPPHFAHHPAGGPAAEEGPGATVGGMVAAGWAGPARVAVGSVRDYVLGAQLINGRGETLNFGGQVMKNVAGYDVSRLLAGSWGALGVITELSLKVLPLPVADATLCFERGQAEALAMLQTWRGQPLPINASCWVRDDTAPGAPQLLFVRLRGAAAAVESAAERLLQQHGGRRLEQAQVVPDWAACRDQRLPFFAAPAPGLVLWRLSLPATSAPLDGAHPTLIEWHGALRWVWAPLSEGPALQRQCQALGGHARLFVCPEGPIAPANPVAAGAAPSSDPKAVLQRRLLAAFDPQAVFGGGRLALA